MTHVRHRPGRARRLAAADARTLAERLLADIPSDPADVIAERRAVLASIGARPAPQLTFVVSADLAVAVADQPPAVCVCRGSGWVCEDHQWVPFAIDAHFACPCDAPGAPCRDCSPLAGVSRTPKPSKEPNQ